MVTNLKSSNFKDSFSALTLSENSRSNPPRKNMCSHCSKSSFDKTLINCGRKWAHSHSIFMATLGSFTRKRCDALRKLGLCFLRSRSLMPFRKMPIK